MMKIAECYINCIAHGSSECNLLLGDTKTAVFDLGMMFCAEKTIENIKKGLKGRPLDYIFATHTHYDHIGALPFFRKAWPEAKLVTSEIGAGVLLKDTPRRVIRELSLEACKNYGASIDLDYDDDAFHADVIVKESDVIDLGGLTVETVETPGHTRDSLSYYVPELELLILCETPGVLMPDGSLYPCFLTSFNDCAASIEKCRRIPYKYLSLPHRGITEFNSFFDKFLAMDIACRDFILDMRDKNLSPDEMLERFFDKYASDALLSIQPKEAFLANARATINCTLKEY